MRKNTLLIAATAVAVLAALSFNSEADCRSQAIKHLFDKANGYPHGRKGYIVDHICALECGGKDSIVNMQYQTVGEAKSKDRWEGTKSGCALTCNPLNSTYPVRKVFNCHGKEGLFSNRTGE